MPLTASEIALYLFLLNRADQQDWLMPVNCANSLICPMLFKTATLERTRKRLQNAGLLDYKAPRNGKVVPAYTITVDEEADEKASSTMTLVKGTGLIG